jgi:hypothetical protein
MVPGQMYLDNALEMEGRKHIYQEMFVSEGEKQG